MCTFIPIVGFEGSTSIFFAGLLMYLDPYITGNTYVYVHLTIVSLAISQLQSGSPVVTT